jgi:undecaprenyl-diphosphatase
VARSTPFFLAGLPLLWLAMALLGGSDAMLDQAVLSTLHADGHALAGAARVLTEFGGHAVLIPAAAAAALFLAWSKAPRRALLLFLVVGGGRLLVEIQKSAFGRARPDPEGHLVSVTSLSFPSGHAANSMITWLAVALVVAPLLGGTRLRTAAIVSALALSLLVGASRVVLGVHWPSDVIGGWAFGLAWTLGLFHLFGKAVEPRP